MTKRDFFILTIKLFGLYVIVSTIFSGIPNSIIRSLNYIDLALILLTVLVIVVTVGLFWLLVFKADWVVGFLKLDQGFRDEQIELGNLKALDLIKIGIFIIGGLTMFDFLPRFLSQLYWAFKGDIAGQQLDDRDKFSLAVYGLNVLLGYLLMTNYEFVANRFRTKKNED